MANKAQQELESLLAATGEVETADKALSRIRESREPMAAPVSGEAGFAFPEALVTAVGAGWILGPVGGLALGLAQGLLGQKAEQGLLDQFQAENDVLGETNRVFNDEIDRLAMTTKNPEDLEQLSALQTQKDAALKMMNSASPMLREQGASMLAEFNTGLQNYTVRQEQDRIAAEAYDEELRRTLDNEQYARFTGAKVRFDDESQNYEDILGATNTAMDALANGTPAQLWAAGILVNKALDPTGIVRQEEAEGVGKLGNLWTKANVILEKARTGQTILPKERRELQDLLVTIQDNASRIQLARESRYLEELADSEIPVKYWDNFTLVESVPRVPKGIVEDRSPGARQGGTLDEAAEAIQDSGLLDTARGGVTDALETISNLPALKDFQDWYSGSGREARRKRRELPTN